MLLFFKFVNTKKKSNYIKINEKYYFLPTAKAMIVEWFLVKKYLLPASNSQSSLSEICWYPTVCRRLFASSETFFLKKKSKLIGYSRMRTRKIESNCRVCKRNWTKVNGDWLPTAWKAVGEAFKKWRKSETIEFTSSPFASAFAFAIAIASLSLWFSAVSVSSSEDLTSHGNILNDW